MLTKITKAAPTPIPEKTTVLTWPLVKSCYQSLYWPLLTSSMEIKTLIIAAAKPDAEVHFFDNTNQNLVLYYLCVDSRDLW